MPLFSIAVGVLVGLLTGSIVAGVATFVGVQLLLLLFVAVVFGAASKSQRTTIRRFK